MSRKMTSRERVLASISHREPDRLPVDLGATPSSGISTIAYYNLKQHLGISEGHTRVYDVVQQLAEPEEFILDRFGIDAVDVGRTFNTRDEDWYDIDLPPGPATGETVITVQFPAWFRPVPRGGRELGRVQRRRDARGHDADRRHLLRRDLLPLRGRLPGRLSRSAGRDEQTKSTSASVCLPPSTIANPTACRWTWARRRARGSQRSRTTT